MVTLPKKQTSVIASAIFVFTAVMVVSLASSGMESHQAFAWGWGGGWGPGWSWHHHWWHPGWDW